METILFTTKDPIGFHARPASILANTAGSFAANFKLTCRGREANPASMLSIMALGIKFNDEVEITAEGPDEKEAMQAIIAVLKANNLL